MILARCSTVFAIIGLLAGNAAMVPHTHAAMSLEQQRDHDLIPHFHCGPVEHAEHGHRHSHTGRHADQSAANAPDGLRGLSDQEHDATAIYLAVADSPQEQGKQVRFNPLVAAGPSPLDEFSFAFQHRAALTQWHPPDKVLDASEIYLTLRNLRI